MASRGYLVGSIVFALLVWATPGISRAGPFVNESSGPTVSDAPSYVYLTQWGSAGTGDGQFLGPGSFAVASPDGPVYVADTGNDRIEKFSSSGTFLTKWGSAGSGPGQFSQITGVAVESNGNVDVLDRENDRIEVFTSTGTFLGQVNLVLPSGLMIDPIGLAVDAAGNRYVLGGLNGGLHGIAEFNAAGSYVMDWGSDHLIYGDGSQPVSIAASSDGYVYVANVYKGTRPGDDAKIVKFTSTGAFVGEWGGQGTAEGLFTFQPGPLTVDNLGHVFVVDNGALLTGDDSRIEEFSSSGDFITQWGSYGSRDGQFVRAAGIATDQLGKVYIADGGNNRVEVFAPMTTPTSTSTPTQTPTVTPTPSPTSTSTPTATPVPSKHTVIYLPLIANQSPLRP